MVGKFKAKKFKGTWCFIAGDDGKDYFFHVSNLKNPSDYVYVIDGNECAFDIKRDDGEDSSLAHNVIPTPVELKKPKWRKSPIIVNKVPSGDRYWVITSRTYGTKDRFTMVDPPTVYKQRSDAEEKFYFLQTEHPETTYHLRQCVVERQGNKYVVTSLPYKADRGGVVYEGGRVIYS